MVSWPPDGINARIPLAEQLPDPIPAWPPLIDQDVAMIAVFVTVKPGHLCSPVGGSEQGGVVVEQTCGIR